MKETMCLVFGSHLGTPYICLFTTNLQGGAIVTSLPENFTCGPRYGQVSIPSPVCNGYSRCDTSVFVW